MVGDHGAGATGAEQQLRDMGIQLTASPTPFGSYVEAVQMGRLLFLTGMLPVVDHKPMYLGRLGAEIDTKTGRDAARTAGLSALAAVRQHLGSLNRVRRVIRHSVFIATYGDFLDLPAVADGASDLFRDVFGAENLAVRTVIGVASLPLGVPVEVEVTLEVDE